MLVLARKENERIIFPDLGITLEVLQVKRSRVRLGISAPPEVSVIRGELCQRDKLISTSTSAPSSPALS